MDADWSGRDEVPGTGLVAKELVDCCMDRWTVSSAEQREPSVLASSSSFVLRVVSLVDHVSLAVWSQPAKVF